MLVRSYEVEEVKFPVALRGYAEDEVDAFLDRVVETIKEYERSDAERRSEIKRLQAALDECREARIREGGAADAAQALSEETETRLQDMVKESRPRLRADGEKSRLRLRADGGRGARSLRAHPPPDPDPAVRSRPGSTGPPDPGPRPDPSAGRAIDRWFRGSRGRNPTAARRNIFSILE